MIGTRIQREAAAAVGREPFYKVRDRWLPLVSDLARAEVIAQSGRLVPGAEQPGLADEVQVHANRRLREFGASVSELAVGQVCHLLGCDVVYGGLGSSAAMDLAAEWSVAWAENQAVAAGALTPSPLSSVAACEAALACAEMASARLAEADLLAWELAAERKLTPERLHALAERSWGKLEHFLCGIVRHAVAAAPGANGAQLHALQSAISAIAHAVAENFEFEALTAHVSAWQPTPYEEEEEEIATEEAEMETEAELAARRRADEQEGLEPRSEPHP